MGVIAPSINEIGAVDFFFQDYWQSNVQRLQELLEVKPSNQAFPLVIIVAASTNQNVSYNTLSECLNFDLFIDQGFICDVNIVIVDYDEKSSQGVNVVDPKVSEKVGFKILNCFPNRKTHCFIYKSVRPNALP